MQLETMKDWIRHRDRRTFLEDAGPISDEWLTVFERRHGVFEYVFVAPMLVGPRQRKACLRDVAWNAEYNFRCKPKLVLPDRRAFLCKAFSQCIPGSWKGSRKGGSEYEAEGIGIIARREVAFTNGSTEVTIVIKRDSLRELTLSINKALVLAFQITRFSERTLAELDLEDRKWEFSGETFRYDMFARPEGWHHEGSYQMFSTLTQIFGKKLVRL